MIVSLKELTIPIYCASEYVCDILNKFMNIQTLLIQFECQQLIATVLISSHILPRRRNVTTLVGK